MNTFDLQIQTTASDGKHSPAECVAMAKANGVYTIAITDHDTVAGVAEALAAGEKLGVRVIPGIEVSAQEHRIHILGFGVDTSHPPLLAMIEKFRADRLVRGQRIAQALRDAGLVVEWEDVLREVGSAVVTSLHVVEAAMKRPENREKLEGITTKHEFYQRFLANGSSTYVRLDTITAQDAIQLIHDAGGVAVWSHPTIPEFVGKCAELEEFLRELIGYGLDGIELFGPFLTEGDFQCLKELAGRYNLLVTAGSDFHESKPKSDEPWPRSAATIGDYPTYGRSLDGILPALDAAMAKRRARSTGWTRSRS